MAYAESTIGGSLGGQFRCWVNSIQTRQGDANDNSEDWRVEGGVKRVTSGSRVWNNFNQATYTIQLGMNGVATSGHFNYDSTGAGGIGAWGTGATRVGRDGAGNGFGFQSRTDINMSNSPYLTSGWVTSNDSVRSIARHAVLTAISTDAGGIPFTDEGPAWIEFNNPSNGAVSAFIDILGYGRLVTTGAVGSRYNYDFTSLTPLIQAAVPNSNTFQINIGTLDHIGGGDTYDYRVRDGSIKNDLGQANPTFSNYTYSDTNSATVAVTGSNQVLIQGKSTLQTVITTGNKATANKSATMVSYLQSIGGYSDSDAWSSGSTVTRNIGTVDDVSGSQTLNIRAIDSRGNGTTVTKNVTILPYYSPGFYNNFDVKYANDFDIDDGITLTLFDTNVIGSIAPMTLSGTDKNAVTPTTGIRFDIAKDVGSFTGTWTNVAFTTDAGTGLVHVTPATLATQIQTKMNGMGADNTVRWYVLFQIQDKLETQYYTVEIDVGEPFFRIGSDGRLYYKEIEFFDTFSGKADLYYPSVQAYSVTGANWTRFGASGYIGGWGLLANSNILIGGSGAGSNGDVADMDIYMPAGVYQFVCYFFGAASTAKVDVKINGSTIISAFDTYNAGGNTDKIATSGSIGVLDGATYNVTFVVNGRNAANTTNFMLGIFAVKAQRIGDL